MQFKLKLIAEIIFKKKKKKWNLIKKVKHVPQSDILFLKHGLSHQVSLNGKCITPLLFDFGVYSAVYLRLHSHISEKYLAWKSMSFLE